MFPVDPDELAAVVDIYPDEERAIPESTPNIPGEVPDRVSHVSNPQCRHIGSSIK